MTSHKEPVYFPQMVRLGDIAAKVGQFLWHLVQMILAMEAGMMVYHLLILPVLNPTGYGALTRAYPLFGYWMMLVFMVLGMIALMLFHRSNWRYILEMTIAMLAPLAVLTVLVLLYVLTIHTLYGVGDPVMILAMTAFMLFRPHQHTHSGHEHACHQHASSVEDEISNQTKNKLNDACEKHQEKHSYHTA